MSCPPSHRRTPPCCLWRHGETTNNPKAARDPKAARSSMATCSSIVYTNGPNGRPEALTLDLCTLLRSLTARAALATTHGPCGKITRLERGQVDRRLAVYGSIVFQHSRNYETMRAMVFLDHAGAQLQDLIRGGVKRGALANVAPR